MSSEAVSTNPTYLGGSFKGTIPEEDINVLRQEIEAASRSRFSRKAKLAMMTLGVCAVAGSAFAVGYFVSPKPSVIVSGSGEAEASPEEAMYAMVQNDVQLASSGAIGDIYRLADALDKYLAEGVASDGLTLEFLEQLAKIAPPKETRRMLREPEQKQTLEKYGDMLADINANPPRELQSSSLAMINQVFAYADDGVENMPNRVSFGSDFGAVELRGRDCYVMVKETDDPEDQSSNFNTNIINVLNVVPNSNGGYGSTVRASEGFAAGYNGMRLQLWSNIQSVCINRGADTFNFGGYSRGGAIVAIMARALVLEGRLPASQVRLATYGAPRALASADGEAAHATFEQWRLVFRGDPVPSVPFSWQGFRHYGWNICRSCSYTAAENAPGFVWPNVNEHLIYDQWLPLSSFSGREAHQNV